MKNLFARMLACLLLAAALIPCAAMAELDVSFDVPDLEDIFTPAEGYQIVTPYVETVPWVHESGVFSFNVPADWTQYDRNDGTGLPFFYAEDFVGNMSVEITLIESENRTARFNEYKKAYIDLYEQTGYRVDSFELTTYAGRYAMVCRCQIGGVDQVHVMIQPDDYSSVVTFGFAASAIRHVDLVMNSVWMG